MREGGDHLRRWNILEVNSPSSYLVTNVVVLNVNVLRSSVVGWIVGEGDGALVVAFERDGTFSHICWRSGSVSEGSVRERVLSLLLLVSKVSFDFSSSGTFFSNLDIGVLLGGLE